jgi:hypothetical protein
VITCVTPTYDGTGQAIHPDVIDFKTDWMGYRYWMAMTPFANGNPDVENPSILASCDGVTWVVPDGLANPLVALPVVGGFYSDPDIFFHNGILYLLYRWVEDERIDLIVRASADGRNWNTHHTILTTTTHNVSSPAIVWDGWQYLMYSTDSYGVLFQRTAPTPLGVYSKDRKSVV